MARDIVRIDVDPTLTLAELVREVRRTRTPVVLQEEGEDIAVLSPTTPKRRRQVSPAGRTSTRRRTGSLTADDPLFRHIGTSRADIPDVSGNKHRYLAGPGRRVKGKRVTAEDTAASRAAAGSWKGLMDTEKLKRDLDAARGTTSGPTPRGDATAKPVIWIASLDNR